MLLSLLVPVLAPALVQAGERREIIRQAKAATALVICPRGCGTAFCLNEEGLFLTNLHVAAEADRDGELLLIINPGQPDQRQVRARLVRPGPDSDLALLRAADAGPYTALPLGDDTQLTETAEVMALGYPFGTGLALGQDQYPSVSVNLGRITALRREGGKLQLIQLDAELNPGNSGGPVLDEEGRVVGVVVAGITGGAGINFAIPVSMVRTFLLQPEISFTPPPLNALTAQAAAPFAATVTTFSPPAEKLRVTLELTQKGTTQTHILAPAGKDHYQAQITVAPAQQLPPLQLRVTGEEGIITGQTADRNLRVNNQAMNLSALQRLVLGRPNSTAVLITGEIISGPVAGLERVDLRSALPLPGINLSAAKTIQITHPLASQAVSYRLVVTCGPHEIGSRSGEFRIAPPAQPTGLILHLALDEQQGLTAADSSGFGHHGTLRNMNGNEWLGAKGQGGLRFDGQDDLIALPGFQAPTDSFTFALWLQVAQPHRVDQQGNAGIAGTAKQPYVFFPTFRGDMAGAGLSVGTNGISVYEHGDGYMPATAVYQGNVGAGWNHVAVVYRERRPTIFLNGREVRRGEYSARPQVFAPNSIGGGHYGYFSGQMRDVRVYGRAFTAAEVEALFNNEGRREEPGDADRL